MADWYIRKEDGEIEGPLSDRMLKSRAALGLIRPTTAVRKGLNGTWATAVQVKGLFPGGIDESDVASWLSLPTRESAIPTSPTQPLPTTSESPVSIPNGSPRPEASEADRGIPGFAKGVPQRRTQWYVVIEGVQSGPLMKVEVERWIIQGRLSADNFVRQGSHGEWQIASDVEELRDAFAMADERPSQTQLLTDVHQACNGNAMADNASVDPHSETPLKTANVANMRSCPDCGAAVSKGANQCPKCGCRLAVLVVTDKALKSRTWGITIVVLGLIGGFFVMMNGAAEYEQAYAAWSRKAMMRDVPYEESSLREAKEKRKFTVFIGVEVIFCGAILGTAIIILGNRAACRSSVNRDAVRIGQDGRS